MSQTTTTRPLARVHTTAPAPDAVTEIISGLEQQLDGRTAAAVMFFASSEYAPEDLAGPLAAHFTGAELLGCSTAGEFTDTANGTGGISALALPGDIVTRAAAAIGDLSGGAEAGTATAIDRIEAVLGTSLRSLDPARHLGLVLIDGLHGDEEAVNARLGDAAPLLNVVGGSAGDDLAFKGTWVSVGDRISWHGVALLVAELSVPFEVVKTCSFTSTGTALTITAADPATRTVLEFDGRPAQEAYAAAIGVPAASLSENFMQHPVGLMIDGQPWIRSPQALVDGGGVRFYAQILPGMQVEVMRSGDQITDTEAALRTAAEALGGNVSGSLMFNCILRRLETDGGRTEAFTQALGGIPTAGFHTYGETWLGHVNQTMTGVVLG